MFRLEWSDEATKEYERLRAAAEQARARRAKAGRKKTSQQEGLFKQVHKTIELLLANPRHPGLQTHAYSALENPINPQEKVFEAYAQHRTPSAYRVFWCYGPGKNRITLIAITPRP